LLKSKKCKNKRKVRTMKRRVLLVITGFLMVGLIFSACQPASAPETAESEVEEPSTEDVAEEEIAEEAPAAEEEKFKVAFLVPVLANPFWKSAADFAEKMGTDLGMEISIGDANLAEDTQIELVENFIAQGVDGLIIAPVTQPIGPTILQMAEEAGVLVTLAERHVGFTPEEYDGEVYIGFVGVDNKKGGILGAETLAAAGAKRVLGIAGAQGASVVEARVEGFLEAAEENGLEVLQLEYDQELREDGLATMENFLAAYPPDTFDGVWCFNDETALGVIEALDQAGVTGKFVTGLDATEAGVEAIQEGKMLAAPGGQFIDGGLATIMLFDALNGNMPKESWVEMDFLVVGQDNAEAYKEQFLEGLPPYDAKALSVTFNPDASTDDYKIEVK